MESLFHFELGNVIANIGYAGIFLIIFLESAGVPLPGETALVSASIFAGTTGQLQIEYVLAAAVSAAILGDNLGFWFGRTYGYSFLQRYGHYVYLTAPRLKLGQMLFRRHGAKIVFFGRFTALLRTYAAVLAGANKLPARTFLISNATGALLWAGFFGIGGYVFGASIMQLSGPISVTLVVVVAAAALALFLFARKHEHILIAQAEREIP